MRRSPWRRFLATAALGTTLLLAAAPIQAQSPAPVTPERVAALLADPAFDGADSAVHFVGVTSNPDVYVAVVDPGDGTVSIYLCDGAEVAAWLVGTLTDGAFEAASEDGTATATGTSDGSVATGSATLADGTALEFSAALATPPAGFYTRVFVHEGEPMQSRTIQLPDGTAKGQSKGVNCAHLEIKFDLHMETVNSDNSTADEKFNAGNTASRTFRDARRAGCKWATDMLPTT